jgi:hypothetical protein
MSHHFLLPRGRLPDDIPLYLPSKHSVTATSFNSSSRRLPATSLSASPPFPYHPSRATMDGSCWRASYHIDPIAGSLHLCGPPGLLSGSPLYRHGRSSRVATGATMGSRSPALAGPHGR